MPAADREAYAGAASSRARVIGADPPPPAEEIHIWMATADRITRHVTIPRRQATLPVLVSVLRGLAGEPDDDSPEHPTDISDRPAWPDEQRRASVLAFTQNSRMQAARG
jgi:hypothetical protein